VRPERCWPLAVGVIGWTGTPGRCGARRLFGPGLWCAHTRPLSRAGSCRPSPDRQAEAA
jgi:hypothetical protein